MTSTGGGSEKLSVQVVIRVKPLTEQDIVNVPTRFQRQVVTTSPYATNQIVVDGEKKQVFSFDNVFPPESTQQEIYEKSVENMVSKFIEGFNVTILAYGQTSSGKTYTMGTADNPSIPLDLKGVIPRSMSTLFSIINSIQRSKNDNKKFSIKVSFVEIHNEDLIDLLGEGEEEERPPVLIREDSKGNIYWSGLQEIKVSSVEEVISYLAKGSQNRQVGATDMNEKSSRSHAIFSVTMFQQKLVSNSNSNPISPMTPTFSRPGTPSSRSIGGSRAPSRASSVMSSRFDDSEWVTITSKFHFVDLAGSERLKRTSAIGDRAKEGIAINSGLLALGNVISALGDPSKAKHVTHIPYRDSKLTRLLQDSLGGNAKTLLIACVSPTEYNVNETINTLKYANRARNIKNSAVINQEEMGWNDVSHLQSLVIKLRQENSALKIANATLGSNQQQQQQSANGIATPGRVTPTTGNFSQNRKNSVGIATTGIQGRSTPTPGRSTPTSGIPGRSTPTSGIPGRSTPTNGRDTPSFIRRNSSPLSTFTHGNVQQTKEIEMLEDQLVQLQRSYAELSQRYGKVSAELAAHQNNFDDETHLHGQSSNPLNSAKKEKYEETITSLESKLAMMNAALAHSENLLSEQEAKYKEYEESNEHNKSVINSLQNYIKEIEGKLEKRETESKLQTTRLEHPEKFISETVRLLEQRLKERDTAYQELETQYNELKERIDNNNVPQETKILLDKLDDRDRRISQLGSKLNLLSDELDKLRRLEATNSNDLSSITNEDNSSSPSGEQNLFTIMNLESKLSELQKSNENTVTELIDVKIKYQSSLDEIQELKSSLREAKLSSSNPRVSEDDRSETKTLETKFSDLKKTYEKTVAELADTKFKYEECLNLIKELQSQQDNNSLAHSEMTEDLHSISSTPVTPVTPMTPMTPYTDNHQSKESSSNSVVVPSKPLLHRKVKSLSVDLLNSEKHDNAHAAIVEKLQFELKLFESFHKDKSQSLDAVKHELSRLELNHRETLKIVEELREEIRRRDALAKLEVKSVIESKQTANSTDNQIDELEIVQRLREEVEELKEKQRLAMEKILQRENENKMKEEVVERLESNIRELKEQLRQAEGKQGDINNADSNEQLVNELQSRVKELEEKLVKALEFQNKSQIAEIGQQVSSNEENEENDGMLKLREQVSKLQTDIESKSHTIAAILLPENEQQSKIRRLEGELCEVKEALRIAIEEKNNKLSLVSESSSSDSNITSLQSDVMISEESSADKLEQNIDENVIALESTVKELETQLLKAKESQPIPSRTSILHDMDPIQKTVDNLETKLDTLQKVLTKNSDNIQDFNEKELVTTLQSQLNTLKLDIKRKNELIETLKRDLLDKSNLQQMLREKEQEVTFLKVQLDQIKNQDIDVQNQIKELQEQLEKVEMNNSINKALQSELEAIRKELKDVKGKEALTLERLKILDAEESKLQKDLERLRNVEILQRERILVLESQLTEQDGQVDNNLIKLRTELALAKESEISEQKTIANLESKLNKSESEISILQSEIDELKLKENEQLKMIQDREIELNEIQTSSDSNEELLIKRLNEEIEQFRSEKSEQHMKIQTLEMRMKLIQEDSKKFPLKDELAGLKASESHLQQRVHELEQQLSSAQEKYHQLQFMRDELKVLRESESGQKTTIFQLQVQLQETKEAKETVIREWENMRDNFCAQTKLVVTLEGGLQTLMDELNVARENHAVSLKELDDMTNFLKDIMEQKDEDQKKIEELEHEINLLRESGKYNNDYFILSKELFNTKKEMEAQNKLVIEFEKQMETLEKERDQLVTQEIKQREAITVLESTISDLQYKLKKEASMAQTYQDTITKLGEKLTKVELQLDESKASDEKHARMVNEFKSTLKEENTTLVEKEKMIADKNIRLAELEAMVKKTKADLEKAESSKSFGSELAREFQTKVSQIESSFQDGSSSAELKEAQRLANQQLEYIKELEITCDNLNTLTKELEESEAAQAAQATLIEELEKALQKKEESVQELTNMLNETRSKLEKVNNSEVYNEDYVNSLESQLQEARKRRDEEIKKLKQAKIEIETLRKQCDHLRNDANVEHLEELEQKAMQFVTERNEALVKNGALESQIYKIQKDFDSLTDDFEEVATKYADAETRVDEQREQITQLEMVLAIKEREAEKRELEKANERNKVDQKEDSIINQLRSAGQDGNISSAHLTELNNKLEIFGYELSSLQTRSIIHDKQIEIAQEKDSQATESEVFNKSTGNYAGIQELTKKIAELEEENDGKTQLIDMLEETLKENEEELSEAKQQLLILRREKLELERNIENLKNQLDTVTNEYEEMKTSVKEKEEIEGILEEERKLKQNVEMAYAKLESQVEQLLSKRNKFMCF